MYQRRLAVLASLVGFAFLPVQATAQYYAPHSGPYAAPQLPIGFGVDHGLRNNGFYPSVGAGLGPIGAGVGAGLGSKGLGSGVNVGVGPIGVSTDGGIGRNGIGARTSAGLANTGAAFEGGISRGGVGFGTNARAFGIGGGASLGLGNRGPGLGASLAFGQIGTLVIGSHRNSYPGAAQTAYHTSPTQNASYYRQQSYGNLPYYRPQPAYSHSAPLHHRPVHVQPVHVQQQQYLSACPAPWSC